MKKCKICSSEFKPNSSGKYCSDICKKQATIDGYKTRVYAKECKNCRQVFSGRRQESLCVECKGVRNVEFEKIQVSILCAKCNKAMRIELRNKTINCSTKIGGTCDECKEETSKRRALNMEENNPMFNYKTRAKTATTRTGIDKNPEDYIELKKDRPKQTIEDIIKRMKSNNPMKNPETAKKVAEKLRERYASGEIKVKRGEEHWLWTGKRDRCKTIRTRLYKPWIFPIMERDNFSCVFCKKKGCGLEVHHVSPSFNDIIESVLDGRKMKDISPEEFENVSNIVIEKHKDAKGVTCCVDCHRVIDKKRH
jgi:hypothetical protein